MCSKKADNKYIEIKNGYMSPTDNGAATVFDTEKFATYGIGGYMPKETISNLEWACGFSDRETSSKRCPVSTQLKIFKKYVPALISVYYAQQEIVMAAVKNEERVTNNRLDRNRKKWDKDEEELLIELAANDEWSLTQIAIAMGRSPSAIQTKISQLVGVNRLSQEIAGKFIGSINGEQIDGDICGTLIKKKVYA